MQSTELIYARCKFFEARNIPVTSDNVSQVFTSAKRFESKYHITKKELFETYDYQKYKDQKSSGEK